MSHTALKHNDIFLVSDEHGDIPVAAPGELGLYWRDTRFLSGYDLHLNGHPPIPLAVSAGSRYTADFLLTNPAFPDIPRGTLELHRQRLICGGLHERMTLINHHPSPVTLTLTLTLAADFRDIFLVRGNHVGERGQRLSPLLRDDGFTLRYLGRDGVERQTEVRVTGPVPRITDYQIAFELQLPPREDVTITLQVLPRLRGEGPPQDVQGEDFETLLRGLEATSRAWDSTCTRVETDHPVLNALIHRSALDLHLLLNHYPTGPLPVAGLPKFGAPFGRDALITAYETLMWQPEIAVGTLRFLAAHQATVLDEWRDAEPGKILHELRQGELAALGEIPHTPYYGTVDATPLLVILFCALMDWLGDESLFEELWPTIHRALAWIDCYSDLDGDGYVEYQRRSPVGVLHQGWKDTDQALLHADGSPVAPPIALVEVQGYVYDAKMRLAQLLARQKEKTLAARLDHEARVLQRRFNGDFWCPSLGFYAQALDGQKRPIAAVTSNPGHLLWSGILPRQRAARVMKRLLDSDLFSGWGIRTRTASDLFYNPMSYHNGAVWPHDTALIAAGLRRYGFNREAQRVAAALLEAGMAFPDRQMPELFGGFSRSKFGAPVPFPRACRPQAWAAGSVFLLLQVLLGLRADAAAQRLHLCPLLPDWLSEVSLSNLRVGQSCVDIRVSTQGMETRVEVVRSEGDVKVVAENSVGGMK
ncbi:MAG TPA: amylo-alpha-1,6-glucosidase [Anaerolineae bacterium]|nr:amylo-alpha-1,6-glucosidase [Anaerolineae bacterium]